MPGKVVATARNVHYALTPPPSNPRERKPEFSTRETSLNAGVSTTLVAQTQDGVIVDGKAEFELGNHLAARPSGVPYHSSEFVRCIRRA